jgi:hypothetical protein
VQLFHGRGGVGVWCQGHMTQLETLRHAQESH